jgi:hypothetical protein
VSPREHGGVVDQAVGVAGDGRQAVGVDRHTPQVTGDGGQAACVLGYFLESLQDLRKNENCTQRPRDRREATPDAVKDSAKRRAKDRLVCDE